MIYPNFHTYAGKPPHGFEPMRPFDKNQQFECTPPPPMWNNSLRTSNIAADSNANNNNSNGISNGISNSVNNMNNLNSMKNSNPESINHTGECSCTPYPCIDIADIFSIPVVHLHTHPHTHTPTHTTHIRGLDYCCNVYSIVIDS